ncbi:MAG: peptide-binding protein [Deltaproteobacteria bacterium]|nr:peptide-binding protein [Candidatus Zymogenaceae bacterium]
MKQTIGRASAVIFSFLILFAPACKKNLSTDTGSADTGPAYGDAVIIGSIGDASTMIPIISSDSSSHEIAGFIYNGLVKYDKDYTIVGDLAESWEISEDNLTITFHLRKDVKWQDGVPFTSDDVMFTYKLMIDPNTPTAYAADFLLVKEARNPDPYTFIVKYGEPFAPALISWGFWIMPRHLLEGTDITTSKLARDPVGTGPYRFKEWSTGEKIVLSSYHDYFEGRPYIDRIIYRIIPDTATMFLELQSGGVDWMGLSPIQYKHQTDSASFKKNFVTYKYLADGYTYLGFNLKDPKFTDVRVRRAISYAIDKQEIIDIVLLGLGEIATGPYKPGTWQYNGDVQRYDYDPKKAKKLLSEAGWKDTDGDGILDKDGVAFSFTIVTNQGNDLRAKSAEIIQNKLKDVGIKVNIRIVEWAAFLSEFIEPKDFEAVILGWNILQDPDLYDVWHSSKIGPNELNHISFTNAEVDRLLEQGRRTFDRDERKKYYDRMQEILAEEAPYVFLYVPYALPAISARFKGIEPAPAGISYNFTQWYVPKQLQRYNDVQ